MEWFAALIPLILWGIWFAVKRPEFVWWQPLAVLGVGIVLVACFRGSMISDKETDTEFLGSYTTQVTYYEPWNEYISQTCTRQVCTGSDKDQVCNTESYDCSYVEYHEEYWEKTNNLNQKFRISEEEYNQLVTQFATGKQFVDMHRDYYTQDGDAYVCQFDGNWQKLDAITVPHSYQNKTKASLNLFNFEEVTSSDVKELGLFEYPTITGTYQPVLVSTLNIDPSDYKRLDAVNATLGATKQVRVFLCVFQNQPREAGLMQENYWQGGNKNELVLTVGVDNKRHIQWAHAFSWEDDPLPEIKVRDAALKMGTLDIPLLTNAIEIEVIQHWQRKQFADFAYLQTSLTMGDVQSIYIWLLVLGFLIVGLCHFIDGQISQSKTFRSYKY